MSTNRFLTLANGVRQLVTAISTSAGAGDANKVVATGSNGRLDASFMPVGVGVNTITAVASEGLAAGDFVNVWSNSGTRSIRKADASNGRVAHGFVLNAVTLAQNATVYQQGENTALSGLTPGVEMFLSATTPGQAVAVAPSAAGQMVQMLGFAISSTSILFEYDSYVSLQ